MSIAVWSVLGFCLQCGPKSTAREPVAEPELERQSEAGESRPLVSDAQRAPPPLPAIPERPQEPPEYPSEHALRVGPVLSKEARAAGIRLLTHVPYTWPSHHKEKRRPGDPIVVPLGQPAPLSRGQRAERPCKNLGYASQTTITGAGPLRMHDGILELDEWTKEGADGTLVLTAPKEWDGIVQERDVRDCHDFDGSSLVAYGSKGVASYREYLRRYVPWRQKYRELPARFEPHEFADFTVQLATLITADVDSDGKTELIAYTFVTWTDSDKRVVGLEGEIGVVWQDETKAPAAISGMTDQPGEFKVPHVVPARLNGGTPLVFSIEYCCASTGVRWANLLPDQYINVPSQARAGDWQIYLEPSATSEARLLIATGKPVDWRSLEGEVGGPEKDP